MFFQRSNSVEKQLLNFRNVSVSLSEDRRLPFLNISSSSRVIKV